MGAVTAAPPLEPLVAVDVEAIELVTVPLRIVRPLHTAGTGPAEGATQAESSVREVLLVHVRAREAEGWAECVAEASPTYAPEFTEGAHAVLRRHLIPRAWAGPTGDALALGSHLDTVRGHPMARAALELAVLDAQLRAADRSLASWLGATGAPVAAGAALGLHGAVDDLLADAEAALQAGAVRLRVKVAPGRAAERLLALRAHVGHDALLQADANGSFTLHDPAHLDELRRLDRVGLTCLEQPLASDDLLGHARLADVLSTPICLDEPLTSLAAIEAAVHLGACEVVCLKPARVGGWIAARQVHDRCVELGVPMWVGGMLETGVGRAANLAVAGLPGATWPADLDPRPRYEADLAPVPTPVDGLVGLPTGPGTGAAPDPARLSDADVVPVPA
ncbi:MAG: o-succinylbenzoate synthase [Acidimicrobiales bacterium]|nr:o-succinylbenzoate synthase [Acidimicrobiales bacterium]